MTRDGRMMGIAAVIAAAALWGTTGTVQALLPEGKQPLVVAALRLSFGAAALIFLAALRPESRRAFRALPPAVVIFAGLAIGLYNLLFFWAVLETGVGVGTAIAIGSAPLWVTAYEIGIKRQLPDRLRVFGQAISICGAALLVLSGADAGASGFGIALAALSGAAYAAYSLATSRISQRAPSATVAAATFTVAAVAVLPVFLIVPLGWLAAPGIWPAMLFLGICATGVSYALYTWGLGRVAASTAVTLALIEPLTAWALATVVVGEVLTPAKLAGAVLLIAGLAIVTVFPKR
ncbi:MULTISPECIES: DMT family transporter [Marinovum]|uniref:DMT family transporter n=1 Tax=Marinovum TaxID=367771 RepID=UPI00237AE5FB|nr:DMT family transporter [Marinovum sp. PR37]MDD9742404.1 DMT family transporter [Marinovum sp. PR37]